MNDAELARIQVNAATDYLHRLGSDYKLDMRSCLFWARVFSREV